MQKAVITIIYDNKEMFSSIHHILHCLDCESFQVTTEENGEYTPEEPKSIVYPCEKCGKPRTKAEGGTTFTVCDECWDKDKKEPKEDYCKCKYPYDDGDIRSNCPVCGKPFKSEPKKNYCECPGYLSVGTCCDVCHKAFKPEPKQDYCECKDPDELFARDNNEKGYMYCNKCRKEIDINKQSQQER